MEEKELLLKIENLEKRVSLLEKQLETISQINQSEKVKEYIASAEKANKIAKLLDATTDKKTYDSQMENETISGILSSSSILKKIDTAKEFVNNVDLEIEKQIRENNDEANKYDWDTLFDYEEVNGQITIKSYIGFDDMDVVVIPDRINDLLVTRIGEKAFENCKNVKEVILPKNLDLIERDAFKSCGLKSIILPENISSIKERAFSFSELESIHITSRIRVIAQSTFACCKKLKKVSFSKGIRHIGYAAFWECESLRKIDLPQGVKTIENEALYNVGGCRNIHAYNDKYPRTHIRIPDGCSDLYGLNIDTSDSIFGMFPNGVIIYCNAGSAAMKYARKYSIPVKRYEEFDLLEE